MSHDLITILGPTASGKTKLACHLAAAIHGEIISADSRQFYKGMDIGTGKDLEEYNVDGIEIKHHLIDIRPAGYQYNIEEFQRDFTTTFEMIKDAGNMPILCGGSGLYIETALNGGSFLGIPKVLERGAKLNEYSDEQLELRYQACQEIVRKKLNAVTRQRKIRAIEIDDFLNLHPDWQAQSPPHVNSILFGLDIDRELRRKKISDRLSYRMNNGLIEEVQSLIEGGLSHQDLEYYGLEYKWVSRYLRGEIAKRELFGGLSIAIHQFAKKQMTWFRRMEKRGYEINWLSATHSVEQNLLIIQEKLKE